MNKKMINKTKDIKQLEPSYIAAGSVEYYKCFGKHFANMLYKDKCILAQIRNSTSSYLPKKNETTCPHTRSCT